jgi:hypothetical protein
MASTLRVTTTFVTDHWEITAVVVDGGTLPEEIFVYENTGTTTLGPFFGTCSLAELQKLQIFTGTAIKLFANKFVRYGQAKINVNSEDEIPGIISALVENVKDLSSAYQAYTPTIQNIQIP